MAFRKINKRFFLLYTGLIILLNLNIQNGYSQAVTIYSSLLDTTYEYGKGDVLVYCSEYLVDTLIGISPGGKAFGIGGWPYPSNVGDPDPPGIINERVGGVFTGRAFLDFSDAVASFGTNFQITYFKDDRRWDVIIEYPDVVTLDPFPGPICTNSPPFFLTGGSPVGGYYTVNGVVTTNFSPPVWGPGTFYVYYFTGTGACLSSSPVQTITVNAAPAITFNPLPNVCINTSPFTLTQAIPAGGTYSGPGISGGNLFSPSVAGIGTHTITYTFTDGICTSTDFETITVSDIPLVSFTGLDTLYCDSDPAVTLTGFTTGGGIGVFTGHGITDNGNNTALFDPSTSGLGYHIIKFTYTNPSGCTNSFSRQVRVGTLLTFTGIDNAFCANDADNNFTYNPIGGTFTPVAGLTDNLNGTAVFSPSASGPGTKDIIYTYVDIYGCINILEETLTVSSLPTVNFTGINATGYCVNGNIAVFAGNHAPLGTFSGPGISDLGNGTAEFNPQTLPLGGPYAITYSYTDPATGCTNQVTKTTFVLSLPTAQISGNPTICYGDAGSLDVNFTGTGPFNFTYTDTTSSFTITGVNDPYVLTVSPTVNTSYTITSVTQANGCSNTGTGMSTVTVNPLTVVTTNPVSKTVCPGDNVTFTVAATGVNMTYQWLHDGNPIAGATSNVLIINGVVPADAGAYRCTVTGDCGPAVTSSAANLTVLAQTTIISEPADKTVCEGDNVSFTVNVTGAGLSYQWQKNGVNMSDGGTISGTKTNNLVITGSVLTDAGVFTCVITGTCGSATTTPATLTVNQKLTITFQPVSKSICPGNNTSFTVAVTGTSPAYQWQFNNVNIPGATNSTLSLPLVDATDQGNYKCVVTGACGVVTTNTASLEVYSVVNITAQPSDHSTCEGSTTDFNVIATGSNLVYQWQFNGTDLVNGGKISGADTPNLTVSNLVTGDGGGYSCIVSGSCGTISSSTAVLLVDQNITITAHPTNKAVCQGDNVIFNISATGTNLTYQWVKGGVDIPGENLNSLVITSVDPADAGSYYCRVTNACGNKTSNIASLSLYNETVIVTQPAAKTLCEGANTSFNVSVTGSNLSYQWTLDGSALADTGKYSGSNTNTLLLSNIDVNYSGVYQCQVSGSCGDVNSDPASLIVNKNILISKHPSNKNVCPGTNVIFEVIATGTAIAYQWQKDGADMAGETLNILVVSSVDVADQGLYRCRVTGTCGTVYTNTASLSLISPVNITGNPTSKQLCEGNNVSFTVNATGTSLTYQWRKDGTDIFDGGRITGTQTGTLAINTIALTDGAVYSCHVSNTCGFDNTLPATLTVYPQTVITTQPVIFNAVENGNASFSVTAEGHNLTYQWYKDGVMLSNDAVYSGVATSILSLTAVNTSHAGSYYCIIIGTCGPQTSNPGVLNVSLLTLITLHPAGPQEKCLGESVSFDVIAVGTNITYQWKKDGVNLVDGARITGSTTSNLNLDLLELSDAGNYSCNVTGNEGIESSMPANLSVTDLTSITLQPLAASKCTGDDATFVISASGDIISYQWQKNGVNISDEGNISGSANASLDITNLVVTDSGVYNCVVTGVCGNDVSDPARLTVNDNVSITAQPVSVTKCSGTSTTFSVTANGGNITYQWKKDGVNLVNGGNISGATTKNLTIANIQVSNQGTYSCLVSGPCGSENSLTATLTVSPATGITVHPQSYTKCEGDDAFFSITAVGMNLTYQWRKDGTNLIEDGVHITGSTTANLLIRDIVTGDAGSYTCFVNGTCGSFLSNPGSLTVNSNVQILTHPVGTVKCFGEAATFSVISAGSSDTYQWKKDGLPLAEGGNYTGTTTPNLTISNIVSSNAGVYNCLVTGICNNLNSGMANLTVLPTTVITIQPLPQEVSDGSPVTFTINATGDAILYQWQKDGVNLTDDANISGSTTTVLSIASASVADAGAYTCIVTGTCGSAVSDLANLKVNVPTAILTNPTGLNLCEEQTAVFSVTATGNNITYQWRKDGSPVSDVIGKISGSTTQNLTISPVSSSDAGVYTCAVTGDGGTLNSSTATLVIYASTVLVSQPSSVQIKCAGENAYFTIVATGHNLTYSWEKDGVPLSDGGNILGSDKDILTVSNVSQASDNGVYRCFITGTCGSLSTDPSTLSVNELPGVPGAISGEVTLCQGENLKPYEVPVISNTSVYEWSLPYGVSIYSGAGTRYIIVNYDIDALGGNFTVRGRNSCGVGPSSAPLTVTVNPKPVADAGFDQNLCSSSSVLNANNNPNGTWSLVSGYANIADPGLFNSAVTNLGKGENVLVWTITQNNCTTRDTVILTNNTVTVNAGQDQVLCSMTSKLDASVPTEGTGSWSIVSGGANFVNFNNPKTSIINIQRGTNVLRWSVNNNGCISSDEVTITNDLPTNAQAGKDTILLSDSYTLEGNTPLIGTGIWMLASGAGSIADPLSPTSDITDLGIGENVFTWTITNNACYSQDEVKVINYTPTNTNAGPDQVLCSFSTKLFGTQPNYGTGQWTVVQGSGTFLSPSSYDTDVVNMGQGVNVFRWTIYEYQVTFDDVTITNNMPTVSNAGIDQQLCTSNASLAGNQPVVGAGMWTIIGGSAIIDDVNKYNSTVSNLSSGSNTFRWTITNGVCTSADEVNISNDQPTQASAGVDQTTCSDSITLYPNTPAVGSGEWSVISGSANFIGNNAYGLAINDNSLKWTISNKGCLSSDTVVITSHKPTSAVTIADKSICVNSFIMPGNTPQYGTGLWTILNGSAILDDPTDPNTLASDLASGLNRFRWTITYEECSSFSEVNISYDLITANAGFDQTLCSNTTIMSASNPGAGTGLWSVIGGSGSANFTNPNMPNTEVTNLDRGTNLLRWTVTNKACVSTDEVSIVNNSPSAAYAGADRSVCGESIFLNANNPVIGTGTWAVLSGSANIADEHQYNSEVTNLNLGQNTLRWTIENLGCTSSDEVIITNNQPVNINAGPDQYLCDDSTQLYATEAVGGYGRWSIASGSAMFTDNTVYNTFVGNLEKGENLLVWTVTIAGCSNSDTVSVTNNLPSLPSAGPDQDNCASESFMAANVPQIGTGKWSIVSGSGTFENSANPYTKVTNAGNGYNLLRWTVTNGSCSLYDEMYLINSLPTLAYAGEDRSVCNTTANLLANPPTTGTGIWKVVSGYGVIDNPTGYNTQITSLGFGPNTIRWTTENGRCRTSDDVIITNNLASVFAGPDQIVYYPDVTLVGNKPGAGTGEWQLLAGQGTLETPSNFETKVTNLGQGANTFLWTINNNGCLASDDVIITYYVLPKVDFYPSPQSGCPPLLVEFINGSVGGNPFTWDFGDGSGSNETNPKHTYTIPGKYNITLTGTGPDGIMIQKDSVVIVREQPDAQLQVLPDLVYISTPPSDLDKPVHCFTLTEDIESVIWDFGDGTTSTELNPLHRYQTTGVFDVTLTVITGYQCTDSKTITNAVTVERKGRIECPNAFTPNLEGASGGTVILNDFSNDVFHCYAEGLLDYHLEIYNRMGVRIFESDDINKGWDGYFNGDLVEESVYVYRVFGTYNNGEKFNEIGSVLIIYNE